MIRPNFWPCWESSLNRKGFVGIHGTGAGQPGIPHDGVRLLEFIAAGCPGQPAFIVHGRDRVSPLWCN